MAQYNKRTGEYVDRNNDLFEVVMLGDVTGDINSSGLTRYSMDAWGRPKSVVDYSLFSATWTFGIPVKIWEEYTFDGVTWTPHVGFTSSNANDSMLTVQSGTTVGHGTTVATKTYIRYQPNKGHLYSTAVTCPNATVAGTRRFGLGSPQNGIYFEVIGNGTDWDVQVARRSYGTEQMRASVKAAILKVLPNFNPEFGHVYDIQFQWRGVGNYFFFIDLQEIYVDDILGTLTKLSMQDPALQPFFSSYCGASGTAVELKAGCVDISSEGGTNQRTVFASASTGDALVTLGASTVDTAILALRVPRNVSGLLNSRGAIMDKLVTWTRDESLTKVYLFRDTSAANINGITWGTLPGSNIEFVVGGISTALDNAFQLDSGNGFQVLGEWADIDAKNIITNQADNSDFKTSPGDILIVSVRSIGAANVKSSATIYFSEEI